MAKSKEVREPLLRADDVVFSTEAYYGLNAIRTDLLKYVTRIETSRGAKDALDETLELIARFADDRFQRDEVERQAAALEAAKIKEEVDAAAEARELAEAEAALATAEANASKFGALVARLKG